MSELTELHHKVLSLLNSEVPGRILDAPCGTGLFSRFLKDKGFSVLASDINQDFFMGHDINFQKADLDRNLPFENQSFDYITCLEGLEHLENPHHLLREFHRVLKIGAKLIITTPNTLSVYSRFRYFLIGYFDFFGGYYADVSNFYVFHINPVGFPELYHVLTKNGFLIEETTSNKDVIRDKKTFLKIILRISLAFIKILSKWKIKDPYLRKMMISNDLLKGEILILKCRKIA